MLTKQESSQSTVYNKDSSDISLNRCVSLQRCLALEKRNNLRQMLQEQVAPVFHLGAAKS